VPPLLEPLLEPPLDPLLLLDVPLLDPLLVDPLLDPASVPLSSLDVVAGDELELHAAAAAPASAKTLTPTVIFLICTKHLLNGEPRTQASGSPLFEQPAAMPPRLTPLSGLDPYARGSRVVACETLRSADFLAGKAPPRAVSPGRRGSRGASDAAMSA
jgi:hypothetical protein